MFWHPGLPRLRPVFTARLPCRQTPGPADSPSLQWPRCVSCTVSSFLNCLPPLNGVYSSQREPQ